MRSVRWALPLLLVCGSAQTADIPWRERMNLAERLSAEGKKDEAAAAAQIALKDAEKTLGPEDPDIIHILSRLSRYYEAEQDEGDSSEFPKIEKRLSEIKSKTFDAWLALGVIRRGEGKSLEAEDALKKALALKPNDSEAECELALAYEDMGRFEEAAVILKKLIERNPQDYPTYRKLANVYIQLGRSAEAKETFAQAKKLNTKAAAATFIKEGYFYMNAGEPAHAEKSFESAIAVDTASPFGYHHIGAFWARRKNFPEAEQYFRRAQEKLEADPNANVNDLIHTMHWLGDVIEAQGRPAEAEAVYLKSLEKARPGGVRQLLILRSLGKLYASEGKSAQAEENYKRAVDACRVRFTCHPYFQGDALIGLGRFYLGQGRRSEAESMADRAEDFSADVTIGQGRFDVLADLAGFYADLGDISKREALYDRLLPLRRTMPFNPDLLWVETGLADMRTASGRFPEAEDFYRQAIGILDHNGYREEEAAVLDDLAAIYEKEGKPAAVAAREQAKSLRARQ